MREIVDAFRCPDTGAKVVVSIDPDAEPCGDLTEAMARLLIDLDQKERAAGRPADVDSQENPAATSNDAGWKGTSNGFYSNSR